MSANGAKLNSIGRSPMIIMINRNKKMSAKGARLNSIGREPYGHYDKQRNPKMSAKGAR